MPCGSDNRNAAHYSQLFLMTPPLGMTSTYTDCDWQAVYFKSTAGDLDDLPAPLRR